MIEQVNSYYRKKVSVWATHGLESATAITSVDRENGDATV